MDFKIVDIPTGPAVPSSPIVEALKNNIGKAISIPCGERDANTMRKTLRANLSTRGILKTFYYRSRVDAQNNSLVVWLERREISGPSEEQTAEFQKDKR